MTILSSDKQISILKGSSLKAIRAADSLGRSLNDVVRYDNCSGDGCDFQQLSSAYFPRNAVNVPTPCVPGLSSFNLKQFRTNVAAMLLVSTTMVAGSSITAIEFPDLRHSAKVNKTVIQTSDSDTIHDPLIFQWDEAEFVAAEAVRSFSAEMYADH